MLPVAWQSVRSQQNEAELTSPNAPRPMTLMISKSSRRSCMSFTSCVKGLAAKKKAEFTPCLLNECCLKPTHWVILVSYTFYRKMFTFQ